MWARSKQQRFEGSSDARREAVPAGELAERGKSEAVPLTLAVGAIEGGRECFAPAWRGSQMLTCAVSLGRSWQLLLQGWMAMMMMRGLRAGASPHGRLTTVGTQCWCDGQPGSRSGPQGGLP